jgi:hypothetical protein
MEPLDLIVFGDDLHDETFMSVGHSSRREDEHPAGVFREAPGLYGRPDAGVLGDDSDVVKEGERSFANDNGDIR